MSGTLSPMRSRLTRLPHGRRPSPPALRLSLRSAPVLLPPRRRRPKRAKKVKKAKARRTPRVKRAKKVKKARVMPRKRLKSETD